MLRNLVNTIRWSRIPFGRNHSISYGDFIAKPTIVQTLNNNVLLVKNSYISSVGSNFQWNYPHSINRLSSFPYRSFSSEKLQVKEEVKEEKSKAKDFESKNFIDLVKSPNLKVKVLSSLC